MMLLELDSKSSETPLQVVYDENDSSFEKFAVISKRITSKATLSVNETQPDLIICRTFGVIDGTIACIKTDLGEVEKSKWQPDEHHFNIQTDSTSEVKSIDMSDFYDSKNDIPLDASNLEDLEDFGFKLIEIHVTTKAIHATKQKYELYSSIKLLSKNLVQERYLLLEDGKIHRTETKEGKLQTGSMIPARVKWLSSQDKRPALLEKVRQRRIDNHKKMQTGHCNLSVGCPTLGTITVISQS